MNKFDSIKYNEKLMGSSPQEVLSYFLNEFKGKIALASSMGAEDQVLTHMIASIAPATKIFTLDTGRLFPETYELIERTNNRYNIKIEIYFPEAYDVEKMVKGEGINLFYKSIENRKLCCQVRKLQPLQRALKDLTVWITGLRKEQSVTRNQNSIVESDDNNQGLTKLNPLINWSEDKVWEYIKENSIPYNKLHDQGFPSIGCQPCTRAIDLGDDVRAGRWWWELPEHKECGLHKK